MLVASWNGPQCEPLVDTLWPDGTLQQGQWQTTPHNEWDANDGNENDLPFPSVECPSFETFTEAIVSMDNPSDTPASSDCQRLRMRFEARLTGIDAGAGCGEMRIRLYQGNTLIREGSWRTLATFAQTWTETLSTSQYDNITNHNDLRIRAEGRAGIGNEFQFDVTISCDYVQLEYDAQP